MNVIHRTCVMYSTCIYFEIKAMLANTLRIMSPQSVWIIVTLGCRMIAVAISMSTIFIELFVI